MAAWTLERKRWLTAIGGLATLFAASQIALNESLQPRFDRWGPTRDFCRELRAEFAETEMIHVFGLGHDPIACYLSPPVNCLEQMDALQARLTAAKEPLLFVLEETRLPELRRATVCRVRRRQPEETGPRPSGRPRLILATVSRKKPASPPAVPAESSPSPSLFIPPQVAGAPERQ